MLLSSSENCADTPQIMIENIHSEMYSRLLEHYITDADEQTKVLNAVENFPAIKEKVQTRSKSSRTTANKEQAEWCLRWSSSKKSFGHRLGAFAAVEGTETIGGIEASANIIQASFLVVPSARSSG